MSLPAAADPRTAFLLYAFDGAIRFRRHHDHNRRKRVYALVGSSAHCQCGFRCRPVRVRP
jgi:hypothetical protein